MKYIQLFLPLFIIYNYSLYSQPVLKWEEVYHGSQYDIPTNMTMDSKGNFIVTGTNVASQQLFTNYQVVTVKYDSAGNELWLRKKDNPNSMDDPNTIFTDDSCNIYITGKTSDKYFLMKYDPDGNEKWIRLFGDSFVDAFGTGTSFQRSQASFDKNSGQIYCLVSDYDNNKSQTYLTRYNTDGEFFWDKTFPNISRILDGPINIHYDGNDFLYLFGMTIVNDTNQNFYLQKVDTSGHPIWYREYDSGDSLVDVPLNSAITPSNDIFLTGYASRSPYLAQGNHAVDVWLLKIDPEGNPKWQKFIDTTIINGEAYAIYADKENNVYLTGSLFTKEFTHQPFIVKYDDEGNEKWQSIIEYRLDYISDIVPDEFDNLYIYASIYGFPSNNDLIILKYDTSGTRKWEVRRDVYGGNDYSVKIMVMGEDDFIATSISYSSSGSDFFTMRYSPVISRADDVNDNNLPDDFVLFNNYPNPFNPSTIINFSLLSNSFVDVTVYSSIGEKIKTLICKEMSSGNNEVKWNGTNEFNRPVSSGTYFASVKVNGKVLTTKMILQK